MVEQKTLTQGSAVMAKYVVTWTLSGSFEVEAETEDAAIEAFCNSADLSDSANWGDFIIEDIEEVTDK